MHSGCWRSGEHLPFRLGLPNVCALQLRGLQGVHGGSGMGVLGARSPGALSGSPGGAGRTLGTGMGGASSLATGLGVRVDHVHGPGEDLLPGRHLGDGWPSPEVGLIASLPFGLSGPHLQDGVPSLGRGRGSQALVLSKRISSAPLLSSDNGAGGGGGAGRP